ncbi:unnamed protein product [Adineta steineri]|uniref:RING-type domain-containing protein n=1 Tax=Adineta steineri TaxID=433720 RepID=A0A819WFB5_9BILA|nr:unnamed protein product [Adineta steineri]
MANAHTGFGIQPVEINRDIYANYHTDFGIQPVEINRGTRGNGMMTNEVDIEHLAAFRASQLQQSRSAAVLQQKPDSRYIQGPTWLGQCAICQKHDNQGFFRAYDNGIAVCGHPFCRQCADIIMTKTRTCPKCRRIVNSFQPVNPP